MAAEHQEHHHEKHPHGHEHHPAPFWKRLHRDWRCWVALVLMLAAMSAYVLSDDESILPGGQFQQPMPAAAGP
jgi:hypothetical protein